MKLTKNADPDKYGYSGYGITFDSRSQFSWSDDFWGKNVIIFGVDMSLSVDADNKKRVFGEGPTKNLDNTSNIRS